MKPCPLPSRFFLFAAHLLMVAVVVSAVRPKPMAPLAFTSRGSISNSISTWLMRGGGGGGESSSKKDPKQVNHAVPAESNSIQKEKEIITPPPPLPSIVLYMLEGNMCPYACRTWMVLIELGFPHEIKYLNRTTSKSKEYLKINPNGKVPSIVNQENGDVIYESAICNEYLSEIFVTSAFSSKKLTIRNNNTTTVGLMPTTPGEKAKLRLLNHHYDDKVGSAQYTFLTNKNVEQDDELRQALEQELLLYENSIEASGGPYLMGENFTLADVHLLPFFVRMVVSLEYFKGGYELSGDTFPRLLAWYESCRGRESVRRTEPTREKIIEVYSRFVDMNYGFGGLNKNKK